jgi:hypothetical protein
MKTRLSLKIKLAQSALRISILLVTIGVLITACGFAPRGLQNLFRSNESSPIATENNNLPEEGLDTAMDQEDAGQGTVTLSKTKLTHTMTPSFTASGTASLTLTLTLTHTASVTSTKTFVYVPPTYTSTHTRMPPTNTSVPPSNTPIPPSETLTATDIQVTEPPTQEPTEAPTEAPTEKPVCYLLTVTHTGEGNDPSASPKNSAGCSNDHYSAGQIIVLSNAIPASRWEIDSWIGTINDYSVESTNRVKMPARDHTVMVIYDSVG